MQHAIAARRLRGDHTACIASSSGRLAESNACNARALAIGRRSLACRCIHVEVACEIWRCQMPRGHRRGSVRRHRRNVDGQAASTTQARQLQLWVALQAPKRAVVSRRAQCSKTQAPAQASPPARTWAVTAVARAWSRQAPAPMRPFRWPRRPYCRQPALRCP